jgi:hypothetical protein
LLFNMSIYWGPFHLTSTPPIDEFFWRVTPKCWIKLNNSSLFKYKSTT